MIVLGPHVLSHHHVLQNNDDDDGEAAARGEGTTHVGSIGDIDPSDLATNLVPPFENKPVQHPTEFQCHSSISPEERKANDERLLQWQEARIRVSMELGSIGAPPLAPHPTSSQFKAGFAIEGADIKKSRRKCSGADKTSFSLEGIIESHIDSLIDLATAHTRLLQTMNRILEILSVGTGLRLGLGSSVAHCSSNGFVNDGNSRLVSRAEKAWVSRQMRRLKEFNTSIEERVENRGYHHHHQPKLTMQRIRHLLHKAIVDQATSLQVVLESTAFSNTVNTPPNEWNEFIHDLQLSSEPSTSRNINTPILTLSQLCFLLSRMGGLLSFILSEGLSSEKLSDLSQQIVKIESMIECATGSVQMARERMVFLQSAFPLLRSNEYDVFHDSLEANIDSSEKKDFQRDSSNANNDLEGCISNKQTSEQSLQQQCHNRRNTQHIMQRQQKKEAENIIANLHIALETARISLWAFGDSISNRRLDQIGVGNVNFRDEQNLEYGTSNSDEPIRASNCYVEECSNNDGEDTGESDLWWSQFKELISQSWASISEFEDRFLAASNENGDHDDSDKDVEKNTLSGSHPIPQCSELISSIGSDDCINVWKNDGPPTDKILVFSGSGTHKKSQQSFRQHTDHGNIPPPPTHNVADQMMLLRDLERRLKTMGLAEEHEVVSIDICDDNERKSNSSPSQNAEQDCADIIANTDRPVTKKRVDTTSRPFFLGVSGALLTELSNAMSQAHLGERIQHENDFDSICFEGGDI